MFSLLPRSRSPNVSNRPRQRLSISVHAPHNGGGAGSTIRDVVSITLIRRMLREAVDCCGKTSFCRSKWPQGHRLDRDSVVSLRPGHSAGRILWC